MLKVFELAYTLIFRIIQGFFFFWLFQLFIYLLSINFLMGRHTGVCQRLMFEAFWRKKG